MISLRSRTEPHITQLLADRRLRSIVNSFPHHRLHFERQLIRAAAMQGRTMLLTTTLIWQLST